jgi:NADPH:quinone reductase-like Zn-dependent oxidoreductase
MRVFIPDGAGGVGTFAIQVARHLGAKFATTASSRGRALVERLGADVVVDYTTHDFAKELRDYDGAFDLVGGDTLKKAFSACSCTRAGRTSTRSPRSSTTRRSRSSSRWASTWRNGYG